jgi:Ca2+/Na+ antiporter
VKKLLLVLLVAAVLLAACDGDIISDNNDPLGDDFEIGHFASLGLLVAWATSVVYLVAFSYRRRR